MCPKGHNCHCLSSGPGERFPLLWRESPLCLTMFLPCRNPPFLLLPDSSSSHLGSVVVLTCSNTSATHTLIHLWPDIQPLPARPESYLGHQNGPQDFEHSAAPSHASPPDPRGLSSSSFSRCFSFLILLRCSLPKVVPPYSTLWQLSC